MATDASGEDFGDSKYLEGVAASGNQPSVAAGGVAAPGNQPRVAAGQPSVAGFGVGGNGSIASAFDDDGDISSMSRESRESRAESGDAKAWIPAVLKSLAATQHELATKGGGSHKGSRNLSSIRLDDFDGGRGVSAHQYRMWKKEVEVCKELNQLSNPETAMLIYRTVKGRAKQLLSILEVSDLKAEKGLDMIWTLLDQAHEKMAHERTDDVNKNWEKASRRPGQSMDEWTTYVRKLKMELEEQDRDAKVTPNQLGSRYCEVRV